MKRLSVPIVGIALAALLTACTVTSSNNTTPPAPEAPDDSPGTSEEVVSEDQQILDAMDELYEAAKAAGEKELVVYGTVGGDREKIFKAFEANFPEITVHLEAINGADLFSRVNQEVASGSMIGDVVYTSQPGTVSLLTADRYEPYIPITAERLAPEHVIEGGKALTLSATPFVVAVNTDLTTVEEAPSTWAELVDPKYAGQLTWTTPTVPGPASTAIAHLLYNDLIDEEWIEELGEQEINFTTSQAMGAPIASGERPILPTYPYDYYLADVKKGVPIDFKLFDDPLYASSSYSALLRGAPHENAAKLLITWLFTKDSAQVQADLGQFSFIPEAPQVEGLPPLDEIELFAPIPFDVYDDTMKSTVGALKEVFD